MKKFLLGSLLALTTIASSFACWFTRDDFSKCYIAGVNNFVSHFENNTYKNNQSIDLPITVWVKVEPRLMSRK